MKKTLKKRSKRLNTRDRVKQEKKKREHDRKIRKDKRDNPGKYRKSKKDPGVPNICPFKEEVLQQAEEARNAKAAEKEKRREAAKLKRIADRERVLQEKRNKGLEGLVQDAQKKNEEFENGMSLQTKIQEHGISDKSAKAFYKEFKRVIDAADVILQILDARDPLGTRCSEVEQTIISSGSKRLVLVLNKADLVPKENLLKWIKYLRNEYPTVAFKASTQSQGNRLGQSRKSVVESSEDGLRTSKCVGADTLMTLLGNYCRNKDVKTSIRVGVVGLPNVGKSSLINSLKRSKACTVGSTPGVTRSMQEVTLDSKIKLLDSPGMVLASGPMTDAGVALRNALKIETLEDPVTPVQAILHRCERNQMMLQYRISEYEDVTEFLNLVARTVGKLKKGGVPNRDAAARIVLQDWNGGRIKYFTHPPETSKNSNISSEIVSSFSKEFNLDDVSFDKMETEDMNQLPTVLMSETMLVNSDGIVTKAMSDVDEEVDDDMEEDENVGQLSNNISIANNVKTKKKTTSGEKTQPLFISEGNTKLKKLNKLREKKERKERRRRDVVATELSSGMEAAFQSLTNNDN